MEENFIALYGNKGSVVPLRESGSKQSLWKEPEDSFAPSAGSGSVDITFLRHLSSSSRMRQA